MVAKPLCPLYKNIIKPLDRARYPELRYLHIKRQIPTTFLRETLVNPRFLPNFASVLNMQICLLAKKIAERDYLNEQKWIF